MLSKQEVVFHILIPFMASSKDISSNLHSCGAVLAKSNILNRPLCITVRYFFSSSKNIFNETKNDVTSREGSLCVSFLLKIDNFFRPLHDYVTYL